MCFPRFAMKHFLFLTIKNTEVRKELFFFFRENIFIHSILYGIVNKILVLDIMLKAVHPQPL